MKLAQVLVAIAVVGGAAYWVSQRDGFQPTTMSKPQAAKAGPSPKVSEFAVPPAGLALDDSEPIANPVANPIAPSSTNLAGYPPTIGKIIEEPAAPTMPLATPPVVGRVEIVDDPGEGFAPIQGEPARSLAKIEVIDDEMDTNPKPTVAAGKVAQVEEVEDEPRTVAVTVAATTVRVRGSIEVVDDSKIPSLRTVVQQVEVIEEDWFGDSPVSSQGEIEVVEDEAENDSAYVADGRDDAVLPARGSVVATVETVDDVVELDEVGGEIAQPVQVAHRETIQDSETPVPAMPVPALALSVIQKLEMIVDAEDLARADAEALASRAARTANPVVGAIEWIDGPEYLPSDDAVDEPIVAKVAEVDSAERIDEMNPVKTEIQVAASESLAVDPDPTESEEVAGTEVAATEATEVEEAQVAQSVPMEPVLLDPVEGTVAGDVPPTIVGVVVEENDAEAEDEIIELADVSPPTRVETEPASSTSVAYEVEAYNPEDLAESLASITESEPVAMVEEAEDEIIELVDVSPPTLVDTEPASPTGVAYEIESDDPMPAPKPAPAPSMVAANEALLESEPPPYDADPIEGDAVAAMESDAAVPPIATDENIIPPVVAEVADVDFVEPPAMDDSDADEVITADSIAANVVAPSAVASPDFTPAEMDVPAVVRAEVPALEHDIAESTQSGETAEPVRTGDSIELAAAAIPSSIEETPSIRVQPTVVLEQRMPEAYELDEEFTIDLVVTNQGASAVEGVIVRNRLSNGLEFLHAEPETTGVERLEWFVGRLDAGESKIIRMHVKAVLADEPDLASVSQAEASFQTVVESQAKVLLPKLSLDVTAPESAFVDQPLAYVVTLANHGSVKATNVMLRDPLPESLAHPFGPELENMIGTLQPGQMRKIRLTVTPTRAGQVINRFILAADGVPSVEREVTTYARDAELLLEVQAPASRAVGRPTEMTLRVTNRGRKPVEGTRLVATLPKGIAFTRASHSGVHDSAMHTVAWDLGSIAGGTVLDVTLEGTARAMGEQTCRALVTSSGEGRYETAATTSVHGVFALTSAVRDLKDPIVIGEETEFEIRVINQGSLVANQIVVSCEASEEMELLGTEGPTDLVAGGPGIRFEPIIELAAGEEKTYRVRVRGLRPGDARFKVLVRADQLSRPLLKEESTTIFAEQ